MESWEDVLLYDEVNTSYNTFLNRFLYYFERSFPLKTVYMKNHNEIKCITQGIKVSSQKMRLLNTLKKNTNLSNDILEYINRYQKIYKSVITEAKRRENDRFMLRSHNKTKAIWQIINKETGSFRQGDYITSLKNGSEETSNQQKIADMLNSFFIESTEDLLANNINHSPVQTSQQRIQYQTNTMFWLPITEIEIERVIKSLRGKPSAGFDEIPEYLAKRCSQYIKKPLVHIFNASLKSGVFPDKMKIAKVRPLYKKGERHEVCNYRPIAVLSVFSKILEKLVYNRLISFVTKYAILTELQNGFRKNKSTETPSQTFIESIQEAMGRRFHVIGIFFDLTKAYDVINHIILLDKLNYYGIRGVTNLWFKSYLSHRVQFVETNYLNIKTQNKYISPLRETIHGVPQGSILGPLLFLLYINDLPLNVQGGEMVLFADDINVLVIDKEEGIAQQKINKIMKQLETWFQVNNLLINIKKTVAMSFHLSKSRSVVRPQIFYNNLETAYSSELRFLGIDITENLKWSTHIQSLCSKLSKTSYIIKSLRGVLSPNMLRSIYFAKFQSLLRYGIIFWGCEGDSIKVFRMQKRVLRIISGLGKRDSCRQIFKDYGILTVTLLYILEVLCYIKKHKADLIQNINIHSYNTRINKDFHVQFCRTTLFKKSVVNMGIELHSKLPDKIKNSVGFSVFKRDLKSFLLKHSFYTINEFVSFK
ncbi:hypothetical protein B7P43_G13693 [Cryptotermes secundus]|uniref:Reverse transcriptase domain-containing protein n=1 Tax=Cryptotermes secundus TaxID=105785 RepID=A0A2J7PVG1_9NEOP|nr:hypothetical protein B7P43_G13693 [Cryptotermes secundus]